ncbi:MAG: hypothetical protein ACE5JK_08185, partial [Candidatus Omnitrophota bacterium]
VLYFLTCFLGIFFVFSAYAELEIAGKEGVLISREDSDWQVLSDGDLRLAYNSLGHVVTLDWNQKNDVQDYMAYIYGAGLKIIYQEEYEAYMRWASLGPAEFDAPIAPHGQVHTIWGDVGEYRGVELLPHLQKWWLDVPIPVLPARFKGGLFKYSVGNGLALGGYYEKYGFNIYNETEHIAWTFHFDVPDIENKWNLGPRITAEKEVFNIKYDSLAWFFAADAIITCGDHTFQPYIGFLIDRTPRGKRPNVYVTPVNTDFLGTYGADLNMQFGEFSFGAEAAANFGKAWSANTAEFDDIVHQGYLLVTSASYSYLEDTIVPRYKFYYVSGNKFTGDDLTSGQIVRSSNREFSVYSPTNSNLADSHYPGFDMGPYVFAGMGYSLNQGILRPNVFYDPYQMTNLIASNAGIDIMITDSFYVGLDYWYLRTQQPPIGADYDAVNDEFLPYTLPKDLGNELDIYCEYYVNDYITLSFLGGIFFPGDYFHTRRGDEDVLGIAPAPRYDGGATNPWMAEFAVTYKY